MAGPNNGVPDPWGQEFLTVEGESLVRVITPRPGDAVTKLGTQTEAQAKVSRAEGKPPEAGFLPQAWAFLKSPGGMIVGGVVGLFLLKRFWK